jgi:hypothetical protein
MAPARAGGGPSPTEAASLVLAALVAAAFASLVHAAISALVRAAGARAWRRPLARAGPPPAHAPASADDAAGAAPPRPAPRTPAARAPSARSAPPAGALPPAGASTSLAAATASAAAASPYIAGPEQLALSPDFRRFLRDKGLGYYERTCHRLRVYAELRRVDPPAFEALLDLRHLRSFTSGRPPRALAAAEHAAACGITGLLAAAALALPGAATGGALAAWGLLNARAWAAGHTSTIGERHGLYAVRGPRSQLAPAWRIAAAHLLDAGFALSTAGAGLLLCSLPCVCLAAERQTPGMRLLRIAVVQERSAPVRVERYWQPPPGYSPG